MVYSPVNVSDPSSAMALRSSPRSSPSFIQSLESRTSAVASTDIGTDDEQSSGCSSSDDEDGVFFGEHNLQEADHLAKLSSSHIDVYVPAVSIPRIRKRDSRDILRRQTLLLSKGLSENHSVNDIASKRWSGGFYEKGVVASQLRDSDDDETDEEWVMPVARRTTTALSPRSSPVIFDDHCNLTFDFSKFRLSDLAGISIEHAVDLPVSPSQAHPPSTPRGPTSRGPAEDENGADFGADSDKENSQPSIQSQSIGVTGALEETAKMVVTIGMGDVQNAEPTEDVLIPLDMGGLRLDDLADPLLDGSFPVADGHLVSLGEDDYSTDSETDQFDATRDIDIGPSKTPDKSPSDIAVASSGTARPGSTSIDSPMPDIRGGPVTIPTMSPHLMYSVQAESGSPCPSLAVSQPAEPVAMPLYESSVRFGRIVDSPASAPSVSPPPLHTISSTPVIEPKLHSPVNTYVLNLSTLVGAAATRPRLLSGSVNGSRLITASADRPKGLQKSHSSEQKAAGRAVAIRGQLESAFGSRFGPPQRSVLCPSQPAASAAASSRKVARPVVDLLAKGPSQSSQLIPDATHHAVTKASSSASHPIRSNDHDTAATFSFSKAPVAVPRMLRQGASMSARAPLMPRAAPLVSTNRAPTRMSKPLVRPAVSVSTAPTPISITGVTAKPFIKTSASNPLKRPLSTSPSNSGHPVLAAIPKARLLLGQPSRTVSSAGGKVALPPAPVFSIGSVAADVPGRLKSPSYVMSLGTPTANRKASRSSSNSAKLQFGTPNRLGTPSRAGCLARFGTPGRGPTRGAIDNLRGSNTPIRPVSVPGRLVFSAMTQSPSGKNTSAASRGVSLTVADNTGSGSKDRGSSEDHEDVSMILPGPGSSQESSFASTSAPTFEGKHLRNRTTPPPSPDTRIDSGATSAIRPKRSIRPPQQVVKVKPTRPSSTSGLSLVHGMSDKELKLATQRNTSKNEVYHCAIDRKIVRVDAPRPPSPTSNIRTTAERDREEKQAGRTHRAKRRSRDSEVEATDVLPMIERVERSRCPGDEEDYKTPTRLAKKPKISHAKSVRWDRELLVIRGDGTHSVKARENDTLAGKSCLREAAQVELDVHGNLKEDGRVKETLKRHKILVTAVFYEGEEPVVPVPVDVGSARGKGKKRQ